MTDRRGWLSSLAARLFVSYLALAVAGGLTSFVVVRLMAPTLFDTATHGLGRGSGGGPPAGAGGGGGAWAGGGAGQAAGNAGAGLALRTVVSNAVTTSLLVGLAVSLLLAVVMALVSTRSLLRPLAGLQAATRRMARGEYTVEVVPPRERELAALAQDVNRLGASLADTEARRVRLLSEVAHEMRTPMTVIDGYVEGMIDGVFARDDQRLEAISTEVRRLRRLSDDLSSLSRAEEGRLELRPGLLDLGELVAVTAERLRPQFDDAGVTLTVTAPAAATPVRADADRLAQVVTNLVGNALRATPGGGSVNVGVRTDAGGPAPRAVVEVTDSGRGLRPEDTDRIFERFFRVPDEFGRLPQGGSGIGLTIARGIMRSHRGELTAASPGPGQGATFTATLPLAGGPDHSPTSHSETGRTPQ